jgi:hypothetical protein
MMRVPARTPDRIARPEKKRGANAMDGSADAREKWLTNGGHEFQQKLPKKGSAAFSGRYQRTAKLEKKVVESGESGRGPGQSGEETRKGRNHCRLLLERSLSH